MRKPTAVQAAEFCAQWQHFVHEADNGAGPIPVAEGKRVVGYFFSRRLFDTLQEALAELTNGAELEPPSPEFLALLKERMKPGKTIPHEQVMARIQDIIDESVKNHASKKKEVRSLVKRRGG